MAKNTSQEKKQADIQEDNSQNSKPLKAGSLVVEAENLISWEKLVAFYRSQGIQCFGCLAAEAETFAQGAQLHGFELDHHLEELNRLALEYPLDDQEKSFSEQRLSARILNWLKEKLQDRAESEKASK